MTTTNLERVIENPTEAGSQDLASAFRAVWQEMKGQSSSGTIPSQLDSLVSEIAFRVEHSEPAKQPSNKTGQQYGPRFLQNSGSSSR